MDILSKSLSSIKEDIGQLKLQQESRPLLDSAAESLQQVHHLLKTGRVLTRQAEVLSDLHFEERLARWDAVRTAHHETFRWALQDAATNPDRTSTTSEDGQRSRLITWLRQGDGFFWISGKPGSGKSTFMKFLANEPEVKSALEVWSGGREVVIANHYFWASGSALQKSDEGLLRSILFHILDQCPELIPKVFRGTLERRWKQATEGWEPHAMGRRRGPWMKSELQQAIYELETRNVVPVRFCFFIDGLDEYSGDPEELCRQVKRLSQTTGIKICVSSRAWNVFEEHLGGDSLRRMCIHELTYSDIRRYATAELESHPGWVALDLEHEKSRIIAQITERAQGVFLWVFLVTRQLKEGLTNHDTEEDLRRRLDDIPADLEEFFTKILSSVDQFYRRKMAGTLKIALAAGKPLPVMVHALHDNEYADANYFLNESREEWPPAKFDTLAGLFRRRLNSRCGGLLEIGNNGRVDFLHRTVSDFLRTAKMEEFIASHSDRPFNPNYSIFQGYATWAKHSLDLTYFTYEIVPSALTYLGYAFEDGDASSEIVCNCIDELELSMTTTTSPDASYRRPVHVEFFRSAVLKAQLVTYISEKLTHEPPYFGEQYSNTQGDPAVEVLNMSLQSAWTPARVRLLEVLLKNGYRPDPKMYILGLLELEKEDLGASSSGCDGNASSQLVLSAIQNRVFSTILQGTEVPDELWEGLLVLVMSRKWPLLAEVSDSVVQIFESAIATANFDEHCICLGRVQDSPSAICAALHRNSRPRRYLAESRRLFAWEYILDKLEEMKDESAPLPWRLRRQYMQLVVQVVRSFVARARHPTLPEMDIMHLLEMLPLDIRKPLGIEIQPPVESSAAVAKREPVQPLSLMLPGATRSARHSTTAPTGAGSQNAGIWGGLLGWVDPQRFTAWLQGHQV